MPNKTVLNILPIRLVSKSQAFHPLVSNEHPLILISISVVLPSYMYMIYYTQSSNDEHSRSLKVLCTRINSAGADVHGLESVTSLFKLCVPHNMQGTDRPLLMVQLMAERQAFSRGSPTTSPSSRARD